MEKWNAKMQFPTDSNYVLRCIAATFGPSQSSGNPMITSEWEVVSPQEVEIDSKPVTIAGVKIKHYTTVANLKDPEKDAKVKGFANDGFFSKLEIKDIDYDNFQVKQLLGLEAMMLLEPEEEVMRANPTAEELAKNKKAEGRILKNPLTGQPLVKYWPKIREIFGLASTTGSVATPY